MSDIKKSLSKDKILNQKRRFLITLLLLCICSLIFFIISISVGRAGIKNPVGVILSFVKENEGSAQMMLILQNIRVPRACASFFVGACISVSGLVYQTTFNNKLISPDILGVSSGCCVGAAVAILLGMSSVMIRTLSFVFGFISVLIAILLPRLFRNDSALTLVLIGIVVGSFMDSILSLLKYIADKQEKLADIVFWIMGSLVGIQMDEIEHSFIISIIPFVVLILISWKINVISLGVEEAQSLGVNYKRNRLIIIVCSTLLTANCISLCGNVGWVGLVIPHIARAFVGDDVRVSLPVSAVSGGLFLMVVDTLSRLISVNEIPLSIITGFVGAVIYTIVLANRGKYINE